jgi:putative thioredoxin
MTAPRFVLEGTPENFRPLVLENSAKGLVLVNYWSPRAGPCLMLRPRLLELAEEFGGRFLLVTLDTDRYGEFARRQGVISIPTTQAFRHGRVVGTLHGAESLQTLRRFILEQFAREPRAQPLAAAALEAYRAGDLERASSLAAQAALEQPDDPRLPLDVARLLILQKRYAQAEALLAALPEALAARPEVRALRAHAAILRLAQEAPPRAELEQRLAADPADRQARLALAALLVTADEYEAAMTQLLEILEREPDFAAGLAREALLALLALLGEEDERVRRVREKAASWL